MYRSIFKTLILLLIDSFVKHEGAAFTSTSEIVEVSGARNNSAEIGVKPCRPYALNGSVVIDELCTDIIIGSNSTWNKDLKTQFNSIPRDARLRLKSISLVNTKFKVDLLLDSLAGCLNLETLKLENVEWEGEFLTKVHLPKLMSFTFKMDEYSEFKFKQMPQVLPYIFFYKKFLNSEFDTELWATVDIRLSFAYFDDNLRNFVMEVKGSDLFFVDLKDTTPLLLVLKSREVNSLTLIGCKINLNSANLQYFHGIEMLQMFDNAMLGASISDIIHSCIIADTIEISAHNEPESVDLNLIPTTNLRHLTLVGISLRWSSSGIPSRFEKLEIFRLELCDFSPSFLRFTAGLKVLELKQVSIQFGSLEDLFKFENLTGLNSLVISDVEGDRPLLVVDLSVIPSIRNLELENCEVFSSVQMKLPTINRLEFKNVKIHENLISNFSTFFENAKYMTFRFKVSPLLLAEILKTNVRFLSFEFDWEAKKGQEELYEEMVNFLARFRIRESDYKSKLIELTIQSTGILNQSEWSPSYRDPDVTKVQRDYTYVAKFIPSFYKIIVTFICALGLIGNTISTLVLSRFEMRKMSSSYILLGLAFFDSMFLITSWVQFTWIPEKVSPDGYTDELVEWASQRFVYPINKTAYTGSVYLTILITIDRFIAVSFPLRAKTILTIKRTIKNIIYLTLFSIILNFPRWFEYIKFGYSLSGRYWNFYHPRPSLAMSSHYRTIYHLYSWSFLMYVLPFILMMVLNAKIWLQVRRANLARREMGGQAGNANADTSITKMLMSVVILFLICNSLNAAILWFFMKRTDHQSPSIGAVELVRIELFGAQPLLINSASNFIIYCAMGTKFRAECVKFLCQVFKRWGECRVRTRIPVRTGQNLKNVVHAGG